MRIPFALASAFAACAAFADEPPQSFAASPDVYRVVAEDSSYRIIEARWRPGQRDKPHQHGPVLASYSLTDCLMRTHAPDGTHVDTTVRRGSARIRAPAAGHWLENIGKSECRAIFFEPKF